MDKQSKIETHITELCPNGVEWKTLGEVCEIIKGKQLNKEKLLSNGEFPVINGGISPSGFWNQNNCKANRITISQGGASAGYVNFMTTPFWAGAHCYVIENETAEICYKFLYFFLKNQQDFLMASQYGAGIPGLAKQKLTSLPIPIPPLEVQQEIVRILDAFNELERELESKLENELEKRKKQYIFYRNQLLSLESLQKMTDRLTGGGAKVKMFALAEMCEIRNGYTPSKANLAFWENGTIPWFRMDDIRRNGRILSDSIQHITPQAVKGRGLFPANSIIMATTATIGEHALIIVDSLANQRFTCLIPQVNCCIDAKYFYYYCFILGDWCKANVNVSGFASVDMEAFKKFPIPIPPLEVQQEVVRILDTFEALTSDIQSGIPAEIKARKKQYEHYRDRLLHFERA